MPPASGCESDAPIPSPRYRRRPPASCVASGGASQHRRPPVLSALLAGAVAAAGLGPRCAHAHASYRGPPAQPPPQRSNFLDWTPPQAPNRTVSLGQLNATIREAASGRGSTERLLEIEAAMGSTFKALPKTAYDGLSHNAASYLVHKYFAEAHQWHIRGLGSEPGGARHGAALVHVATILQDRAPELVEQLLEEREHGRGLALSDAATMAVALRSLVMDDATLLLTRAYELIGLDTSLAIEETDLVDMLLAYGWATSGYQQKSLQDFQTKMYEPSHFMQVMTMLGVEISRGRDYEQRHTRNPFVKRKYVFRHVLAIVEDLLEQFGAWQDGDCQAMKQYMVSLDPQGSGRVPLGTFYDQPDQVIFRFSESADFLRQIGALDESRPLEPNVLIANYILGPANCYSSSTYFQYCCRNECDALMSHIEAVVQAPTALPEQLLGLVGNASTGLVEGPRRLPEALVEKLQAVAARHGGTVPLHGRLFAQWMHFAFPLDCPYPHMASTGRGPSNAALTAADFTVEPVKTAAPDEVHRAIEAASGVRRFSKPSLSAWTDDENLSLLDFSAPGASARPLRASLRVAAMVMAIFAMGRAALRALRPGLAVLWGERGKQASGRGCWHAAEAAV